MQNKLLRKLTKEERRIFEECLDGQDIKNVNVNEALVNLKLIEGQEVLNEHVLAEERQFQKLISFSKLIVTKDKIINLRRRNKNGQN